MWRLIFVILPSPAFAESLVAAQLIRANMAIYEHDVIQETATIHGAVSDVAEIVGMASDVTIYAGSPIMRANLSPMARGQRNQIVPLRFTNHNLQIMTEGRALMRGAVGDAIEVLNLSSRTKVSGLIGADGVVTVGSDF